MQSSGSQSLGATVLSLCPKCINPNSSRSNWCLNCGNLLIGNEFLSNGSSSFYSPLNYQSYIPACHPSFESDQNQGSFANPGRIAPFPLSGNCISNVSVQDMSNLVDVNGHSLQSQASSSQSDLFTDCRFPCIQSNAALGMSFQRPLRQRCISGPCDGGYGIDQCFQSMLWNNFTTFSPFFSELDINEPTHPDHMSFVNIDPEIVGDCRSSHAPTIFAQNGHLSKHSVNRFSELPSDFGIDPNQQQNDDYVDTHSQLPNRKLVQNSGFRSNGSCNSGRSGRGKWNRRKQRSFKHPR